MDAARGTALLSIFTSTGTLICCALPAALVALGAGAALTALVGAVPQLVWLSERKDALFAIAGALLVAAGALQWRARALPCPVDPARARACARARRVSALTWAASVATFGLGAVFAYVLPALG